MSVRKLLEELDVETMDDDEVVIDDDIDVVEDVASRLFDTDDEGNLISAHIFANEVLLTYELTEEELMNLLKESGEAFKFFTFTLDDTSELVIGNELCTVEDIKERFLSSLEDGEDLEFDVVEIKDKDEEETTSDEEEQLPTEEQLKEGWGKDGDFIYYCISDGMNPRNSIILPNNEGARERAIEIGKTNPKFKYVSMFKNGDEIVIWHSEDFDPKGMKVEESNSIKEEVKEGPSDIFGYINGDLASFDPKSFITKVQERKQSLHTNRMIKDTDDVKVCHHIVCECLGWGTDPKIWIDVVEETWTRNPGDADDFNSYSGKIEQDRILMESCGKAPDGFNKAIEVLEKYKADTLAKKESLEESKIDEMAKLPYGVLAWKLGEVMMAMNNEEAYYGGWLYIWPDGETKDQCMEDFGDKESYEELRQTFEKYYKAYHDDGLYTTRQDIVDYAHQIDNKLGLEPIKNLGTINNKHSGDNPYSESLEESGSHQENINKIKTYSGLNKYLAKHPELFLKSRGKGSLEVFKEVDGIEEFVCNVDKFYRPFNREAKKSDMRIIKSSLDEGARDKFEKDNIGYKFYELYCEPNEEIQYDGDNFSIIIRMPIEEPKPTKEEAEEFLGDKLNVNGKQYHVVGIWSDEGGSVFDPFENVQYTIDYVKPQIVLASATQEEVKTEGAQGKKVPGKEWVIYDTSEEGKAPIVAIRKTYVEAQYYCTKHFGDDLGIEEVPVGRFKVGDDFYGPFDQDWNLIED